MTLRHLPYSLLAVLTICSLTPAGPPEGKEPAKAAVKPVLVPLWKKTTVGLPKEDDLFWKENSPAAEWLTSQYDQVTNERRKSARPLIPAAVPMGHGNGLLYANDNSIAFVSLREDKSYDPSIKPGEILWASEFESWVGYRNGRTRATVDQWLTIHAEEVNSLLFNRTLCCSFRVIDGSVCFIDETAIPVPAKQVQHVLSGLQKRIANSKDLRDWELAERLAGNQLKASDHETGKLVAKLKGDFALGRIHYLGAPIGFGGKLFVVDEKEGKVELSARLGTNQATIWSTELAKAPTPLVADPHRRIHSIHLVQAGDLILCPTHLGRVVAVEAKSGKIKWTHEYAPLNAKRFPTFAPEWIVVPPVVVGDKYIYAPADFPELLCLNVADGKKVWSVKKGDGLYPAVVGEQVLVIGEKTLRSLNLKDGSERWKLDLPGLPCGRGAMLGDKYLVPVSEPKTWRGMIAMVDVKNGKITEVLKPDKDEPIGNLVVHQDFLISQTLTEIAVFPIKK